MESQEYKSIGCAVILLNGNNVLCVSRKYDHNDFGCPGGKIEPGESPEDGAIREVMEETGLRISHLRKIYSTYYESLDQLAIAYLAEWEGEISTTEPHVVKWGTWEDLKSGSFKDFNEQTEKVILEMNAHEKRSQLSRIIMTSMQEAAFMSNRKLEPITRALGLLPGDHIRCLFQRISANHGNIH